MNRARSHPDHGRRHRRPHLPRPRGRGASCATRGWNVRLARHARAAWKRAWCRRTAIAMAMDPLRAACAARACCSTLLLPLQPAASRSGRARARSSRVRPDVVLGMGGYVAFPGGMMASLLGRPLVLHEQNSIAGLANRVLAQRRRQGARRFPGRVRRAQGASGPATRCARRSPRIAAAGARFAGRSGPLRAARASAAAWARRR